MKTFSNRLAGWLATSVLALGLVAIAQPALAGIASSKHNLGTGGTGSNKLTAGTAEICVFCHTPHAANLNVPAPLWNKGTTASNYTMYSSTNSATYNATTSGPGSISRACLSCHDGSQAMDNMINAPGSGGYNAAGAQLAGATWTASVGALGLMPVGVARLGTDLRDDHPVGMNYCAGGANPSANGNCTDPDFALATAAGTRYWIEDGTAVANVANSPGISGAGFQSSDLPLYTTGTLSNQVECATCHDPHNTVNPTFLRQSTAGSGICLTCHAK